MKVINLTGAEQKFLDTITRLDLEAIGFSAADQRVAAGLREKLVGAPQEPAIPSPLKTRLVVENSHEIGFKILKLTPSYRHSDK